MPSTPILGHAYRNYRDLCEYLGEPVKTGQAKKDQLKHWEKHFKWEKDGHKFIISEILKPLSPREKLYHTNTKWYPNISKIILSMTAEAQHGYGIKGLSSQHHELILPSSALYYFVGLCSPSFQSLKKGSGTGDELTNAERRKFYEIIRSKYYDINSTVLKSLSKQQIISYTRPYIINDALDKPRLASTDEAETIVKLLKALLDEYGFKSESWIMGSMVEEAFYNELNNRLSIVHPNIKSCYKVHRIKLSDAAQSDALQYRLGKEECNELRQEINEKIVAELSQVDRDIPQIIIVSAIRYSWVECLDSDSEALLKSI